MKKKFNSFAKWASIPAAFVGLVYAQILADGPRTSEELALWFTNKVVLRVSPELSNDKYKIADALQSFMDETGSAKCSRGLIFNQCHLKKEHEAAFVKYMAFVGKTFKQNLESNNEEPRSGFIFERPAPELNI